jgi:hypothetical protein
MIRAAFDATLRLKTSAFWFYNRCLCAMSEPARSGLSIDMMALLRHAVECYVPEILPLTDTVGNHPLSKTDREALRSAVLSEFLSAGLGSHNEPTSYGLQLEQLIDALGHC